MPWRSAQNRNRRLFHAIVVLVLATSLTVPGAIRTAATPAVPPPDGNRFLFVVDLSSSLKKLALPCRQAVFDMIYTGLYGQMKAGDSYGLWTLNAEPNTGIYPMQHWQPDQTLALASHAAKFLRDQSLGRRARVEALMEKIFLVVTNVQDVVVFFISDESTQITGTPLDADLQTAYAHQAKATRKDPQPLITTLIARAGEIVSASVQRAGEPVLLLATALPPASSGQTANPATEIRATGSNVLTAATSVRSAPIPPPSPAASAANAPVATARKPKRAIIITKESLQMDSPAAPAQSARPKPPPVLIPPVTAASEPSGSTAVSTATAVATAPDAETQPKPDATPPAANSTSEPPLPPPANIERTGAPSAPDPVPLTVAARERRPPDTTTPASMPSTALAVGVPSGPAKPTPQMRYYLGGGLLALVALLGFRSWHRARTLGRPSYITRSFGQSK